MISSSVLALAIINWSFCAGQYIPNKSSTNDGDYNRVNVDGSFDFGYANNDRGSSYHVAHGTAAKVVRGRFGARDPASGVIKETTYSAGPRGFRARGPNIHRKMDLDQRPRGPIGNRDDPYFDPSEDPSYSFQQNSRTYSKTESADSRGDVRGHYSYLDDIGERHDVEYIAGKDTGFHVKSPFPDSKTLPGGVLYYGGPLVRGEKKSRGRTSIQRGLDGSYRFISAGPDQRRSESSDAHGNVQGSYTFLDDKGFQRTVHYIAGPGIGYRIVKNSKDPIIPSYFPKPNEPQYFKPNTDDDIFKGPDATAASGHVKPPIYNSGSTSKPTDGDTDKDFEFDKPGSDGIKPFDNFDGDGESDDKGYTGPRPSYGGSAGTQSASDRPSSRPSSRPPSRPPSRPSSRPPYFGQSRPTRPSRPSPTKPAPFAPTPPPYDRPAPGSDENEDDFNKGNSNDNSGYTGGGGKPNEAVAGDRDSGEYDGAGQPFGGEPGPGGDSNRPYDGGQGSGGNKRPHGGSSGSGGKPNRPFGGSGSADRPPRPSKPADSDRPFGGGSTFGEGSTFGGGSTDGSYESSGSYNERPQDKPSFGLHPTVGIFTAGPGDREPPGTTIIRNIGDEYFGVPPGVSVRAHVQSIDLFPFGSKVLSPSEALEQHAGS